MSKLYSTKEVAELFNVKTVTVSYWKMSNKLPLSGRIGTNKSHLFSEEDIVTFIINTHLGKYKTSSINVIKALEKLGLNKTVTLPKTDRFRTIFLKTSDNYINKLRSNKYVADINNTQHLDCITRECYISKIALFGIKQLKNKTE